MPVARFQMPDGRIGRFEVPEGTTPEQAQALIEQSLPQQAAAPKKPDPFDIDGGNLAKAQNYDPRNAIGGAVRGAGSIGATLVDLLRSRVAPALAQVPQEMRLTPPTMLAAPPTGDKLRSEMDAGLTSLIGSDPKSIPYQTTKLLTEVAGTSGAGGAVANALGRVPAIAQALPTLLPAIESAGMSANGAKGAYGLANRIAGGAVNGAVTAGLVDPEQAKTGAIIGAATPPAVQLAGKVGSAVGQAFHAKPISPVLQQTARESVDAGYVIPPNMVAPSLKSQVLESISGKQATQQVASTRNTEVTEKLVRESLGIPQTTPLTKATLEDLRKTAGKAYAEVSSLSPQAAADLEALKIARNESQAWFKAYNRSQSPIDLAKAKTLRTDAETLETALEAHAKAANRPELIPALRDARKEIAKTYTVDRALNDASGTVDARVFGRLYEKGAPLSGGLQTAGKFASAFPSIAKSTQQVGSPAAHNLKAFGSLLTGAGGYAWMGPAGAAAAAVPFLAPPAARSIMFSGPVQRALAAAPNTSGGLLSQSIDELLPSLYRNGPLLLTSGP
jgi:hypothetical protein